nr:uncharacterized protein LOC110882224 [Ipomoea batatas]
MPPRKKTIAKKHAPAPWAQPEPEDVPFNDPKLFERYKFFSTRRICQPYILDLEVARHFGIHDEVEEMVALPEWRYLLMDFKDDTHPDVLVEAFWEELTDGTTVYKSSKVRSTAFLKKEHKFIHYVLSHSICGRFDATSSVSHADMLCLFGMLKRRRVHMGVVVSHLFINQRPPKGVSLFLGAYLTRILKSTQRIRLTEPKATSMQALTAEAVERMREK